MLERMVLYDTLYALASGAGREEALFGTCGPLAREAFSRSLIGEGTPIVWFELPLTGEPRFDLHVAMSRESLREGVSFLPGSGNGYDQLFRWYAEDESGGGGLAFAYDVSERRIDQPAVHVNVNNAPLNDMGRFFDIAAGEGMAELYDSFTGRLPAGWHVWYAGVHPGRLGSPLRVDCFVGRDLQGAYAERPDLLAQDLRSIGFELTSPELLDLAAPILESPFRLELQFDLLRDGRVGSTIGLSAGFSVRSASSVRELFADDGAANGLMEKVERLGLADGRWRHIPDASFTRLVALEGSSVILSCVPTFVKVRLRDGLPLDAKVYIQAEAKELS